MDLAHATTATGTGSDGRAYTVRGFKRRSPDGRGGYTLDHFITVSRTDEGDEAVCQSEVPLVFLVPSTGVTIRCD